MPTPAPAPVPERAGHMAAARENAPPPPGRRLPRSVRLFIRLSRRGLPPPVCGVRVAAGIDVPAADGVPLRTDHYIPQLTGPRPTLLVRTPYGRGFPWTFLFGGLFAERGYHVVIQSCRGTAGSGGEQYPLRHERADGQAAVAWLRQQDWFTGELATIGPSYLGYTQWALAGDAPPELRAMIVQNGVSLPHPLLYPGGAFALENILIPAAFTLSWHRGLRALVRAMLRMQRRLRQVARTLPLIDAYRPALGGRAGFFEDWLTHPDAADPYWASLDVTAGAPVPTVPVSLLSGWSDFCLDPTLAEYRRLRAAGRRPRLVIGPWTHASAFSDDLPIVVGEALGWLTAQCSRDPGGWTKPPVRVHVGGGRGEWRDLPDWPPPQSAGQLWRLAADGTLSTSRAAAGPGVSSFRYDPADPTPSVGGQLVTGQAGAQDNRALEARPDVLVFTSGRLPADLEVIGPVSARLRVRASGPHFDLFARLCDVDGRGRSRNVCDGLIRHVPAAGQDGPEYEMPEYEMTVPMSATAYRFRAGHRLRLQVSGGAHPRFARNTGTGEPPATATRLQPVQLEILHDDPDAGGLILPVFG